MTIWKWSKPVGNSWKLFQLVWHAIQNFPKIFQLVTIITGTSWEFTTVFSFIDSTGLKRFSNDSNYFQLRLISTALWIFQLFQLFHTKNAKQINFHFHEIVSCQFNIGDPVIWNTCIVRTVQSKASFNFCCLAPVNFFTECKILEKSHKIYI